MATRISDFNFPNNMNNSVGFEIWQKPVWRTGSAQTQCGPKADST
jgi:hypothetical protein